MSGTISSGSAISGKKPKFLLDRCIAPSFGDVLRKSGIQCKTLAEVYGVKEAEKVEDTTWVEWAARNGYAVLTANPKLLSVPHENKAIKHHGTKVFCIANPSITKEARSFIIGRHVLSILRKVQDQGPCFWRLTLGSGIRYDF